MLASPQRFFMVMEGGRFSLDTGGFIPHHDVGVMRFQRAGRTFCRIS
jgi:hypothetical protein